MYSKQYIKDAGKHEIVETVSLRHMESVKEYLQGLENGSFVDFHFAIMEVEAWFLGMPCFLEKVDERLTAEYVLQNVGIDLENDPEKTIFHPAADLGRIYSLVGRQYDKHQSDISTIMSKLTTDDILELIDSGKCHAFKAFAESLLGLELKNAQRV